MQGGFLVRRSEFDLLTKSRCRATKFINRNLYSNASRNREVFNYIAQVYINIMIFKLVSKKSRA